MSVTFTAVVDRVMTSVSLIDNVILGTSVVNVSTIALLGVTIIALETLNIGVASVEVETRVLTIKRNDDDVTLCIVNKETLSLIVDGVGVNTVSTGLKVCMSENSVVSTVVLGSAVKVTMGVSGVGVFIRVVSNNGVVDMAGVTMMEETASDTEVGTTDGNDGIVVSSMYITVVGMITSGELAMIISLSVDKLNSLEDGVTIKENTDVGVTVNVSNIDVSMSVSKGELVATGTEDTVNRVERDALETGTLIIDETGMLVLGSKVRITDVGSTNVVVTTKIVDAMDISVLLSCELVAMTEVGSNDVEVTEGVITTSVIKELGTVRLNNGIDKGTLVMPIPNDVLGSSDIALVTKSDVLKIVGTEGGVINGGRLDSIDVNVEKLIDSTSDTLDIIGVVNDWLISNVVWSAENKDDVSTGITIVVGCTDNTGEDGKIVTIGVIVVVKMGTEENVLTDTVVTGCITEVGITAMLVVTISVVAVVWTMKISCGCCTSLMPTAFWRFRL